VNVPVETAEAESLSCPLCCGVGTIARREVLRLAGVDGVLDAVGPRLVELLDARTLETVAKARQEVEEAARREHAAVIGRLRETAVRELEVARVGLERELEGARLQAARAQERSEKLAAECALSQRELGEVREELGRLRHTAAKKGEAGEMDFVAAMANYRHVRLSAKLTSAGDYLLSVAVDEGAPAMRVLPDVALIDCKKDKTVGAGDIRKVAADARTRNVGVAFLVASTRSKDPVDCVTQVDGVVVVATTLEDFPDRLSLLTPYLALLHRLRAEAGSVVDATQRLAVLTERVATKLRDLEVVTKQTRAITKAVGMIDGVVAKVRLEVAALCEAAMRPEAARETA
jgi:hypothetical protein